MSKNMNASTNTDNTDGGKGLSPLELAEKRRRDAQAALTPLQQENIRLKAELAAAKTPNEPTVTPDEQQRLDDLKFTDPEAWRNEMNKIESESSKAHTEHVDRLTRIETDKVQAEAFFNAHPELDKEVIKQIIPTAIQKQYEDGELTIGQVLDVGKRLLDGAPIASVIAPKNPEIGKVAGSDKPTEQAKQKQVEVDWSTAIV